MKKQISKQQAKKMIDLIGIYCSLGKLEKEYLLSIWQEQGYVEPEEDK